MVGHLLLCILLFQTIEAKDAARLPPQGPKKWLTLNGGQPEIVARGGYSGFFPDSSMVAYDLALDTSIPGTIIYCNLHFTKDSSGICIPQINLLNSTSIDQFDPKGAKTHDVNGVEIHGYFGLDYTTQVLTDNVTLRQNIFTRSGEFDGAPIIEAVNLLQDRNGKPTRLWLNIENDLFYKQHKISAETYLLKAMPQLPEFISSPEIGFLKSIKGKLGKSKTKLFFVFLGVDDVEPTTKTTYGALIKDVATIKSFASGIVVPKDYIWTVDKAKILQQPSTLVQDAHKAGISVFATTFANDMIMSYNYSYDPVREYLGFIDNSLFTVDGVLSDFPSTASAAIGCINPDKKAPRTVNTLIISHNGASGDFPGATDLAYHKAIDDGADIIDCSVQMSKDGVAFCSDRPDLLKTTTAAISFIDRSTNIPEVQPADGVFSFDLTWAEIQTLSPQLETMFSENPRNPSNKNVGKFVTLPEFLELAKARAVHGVLISIENAAYLASKKSLDIVGTVSSALSNATFDKQSLQKVLIQSHDSSVLAAFKGTPSYETVLYLEEAIGGAPIQAAEELKKHADAVFMFRDSITITVNSFIVNFTKTVPALHAANVSVYVGILRNEYQNLALDYFSDPYAELSTLFAQKVDGLVTDFPATANLFSRSSCAAKGSPYVIVPPEPGLMYMPPEPVTEPPQLSPADVVDPPLPAVASAPPPPQAPNANQKQKSSTSALSINARGLMLAAVLLLLTIYT